MPTPRLIHPVPVYIRKIDRAQTAEWDDNLHEPIGEVRRDEVPIKLHAQHQPNEESTPRVSFAAGGVILESDGYLLFRTSDLRDADVELEDGDRVVQMGDPPNDREVDFYLGKMKPMGHYPQHGGATLIRAYYADREPSRHRGDR